MERVLITGGSGFIGTNLLQHYADRGCAVVNLDNVEPRNPAQRSYWRNVDLVDGKTLDKEIKEFAPDLLLHMGARTDLLGKTLADYAANTDGVSNLLRTTAEVDSLKHVVFASSMLVCKLGHIPTREDEYSPVLPYSESKVIGEKLVREAGELPYTWTIVRPTSIWGPWFQTPYREFFMAVVRGLYIHPKGAEPRRTFGYIGNAMYELDALINAPRERMHGRTFYLGDYPAIQVRAWADTIRAELGEQPVRQIPQSLYRLIAKGGDLLKALGYQKPPMTSFRYNNLLTDSVFDFTEMESLCGELPYSLSQGVKETIAWLREQGMVAAPK